MLEFVSSSYFVDAVNHGGVLRPDGARIHECKSVAAPPDRHRPVLV